MIKMLVAKWLCLHEWNLEKRLNKFEDAHGTIPIRIDLLFICKKCGKFRKIRST